MRKKTEGGRKENRAKEDLAEIWSSVKNLISERAPKEKGPFLTSWFISRRKKGKGTLHISALVLPDSQTPLAISSSHDVLFSFSFRFAKENLKREKASNTNLGADVEKCQKKSDKRLAVTDLFSSREEERKKTKKAQLLLKR